MSTYHGMPQSFPPRTFVSQIAGEVVGARQRTPSAAARASSGSSASIASNSGTHVLPIGARSGSDVADERRQQLLVRRRPGDLLDLDADAGIAPRELREELRDHLALAAERPHPQGLGCAVERQREAQPAGDPQDRDGSQPCERTSDRLPYPRQPLPGITSAPDPATRREPRAAQAPITM